MSEHARTQPHSSARGVVVVLLMLWVLAAGQASAQSEGEDFEYSTEFNFGININTNARLFGGGVLKYAWLARPNQYHSIGLDAVNISHPKETTLANIFNGSTFTPYKLNYAINFRPSYGREFILFRKGVEEGVHVNARIAGGPSLAAMKPYYVMYDERARNPNQALSVRYDPAKHDLNFIYGSGNLFNGLDQIEVIPGVHAKAALAFEFGRFNGSVIGLESGLVYDYFTRPLPIMHGVDNSRQLLSLYLVLYYGHKNQ